MKRTLLIFLITPLFSFGQIISQYIETNSGTKPKVIEIYNNTGATITFSNSKNMVHKISLFQAGNSIFECKIVDINKYQNPLKFFNIDNSWTTIDWRSN